MVVVLMKENRKFETYSIDDWIYILGVFNCSKKKVVEIVEKKFDNKLKYDEYKDEYKVVGTKKAIKLVTSYPKIQEKFVWRESYYE